MAGQIVHIEIPRRRHRDRAPILGLALWVGVRLGPGTVRIPHGRFSDEQGGAITNMEPGKRGPRVYFSVDDINDGAAKVNELGGKASEAMPVPNMGWFATCTDPHGNEFGLWQNDESAPEPS